MNRTFLASTARHFQLAAGTLTIVLAACTLRGNLPTPPTSAIVPEASAPVRDLGERAPEARVTAAVVLRDKRYDELAARVDAMADPNSPQFHHFMTFEQFLATYAPTKAQQQEVIDVLRAAGFSLDRTYADRGVIDVSASTADAERFFSTTIHDFDQDGVRRFANTRSLVVPASIARYVLEVELNDLQMHTAHAILQTNTVRANAPFVAMPQARDAGSIVRGPGKKLPPIPKAAGGWGPYAVAQGFDFPVQSGWDGRGETAAVIMDAAINVGDVNAYVKTFNITRTAPLVNVGSAPSSGDIQEVSMDVETIAGLSPGASIIVYVAPSLSGKALIDAAHEAVSQHKASVVSSSFDGCEADAPFSRAFEHAAVNGSALGMTFSAASGDWGVDCPTFTAKFVRGVNAPASSPHITGVGGNQSVGSISSTSAWNTCAGQGYGAGCTTGGGVSSLWPIPSYQKDVSGSPISRLKRNVPDVAFPASGAYEVVQGSAIPVFHGTSWSSPIFAALIVQAEEMCKTKFGAVNVTMYSLVRQLGEDKIMLDVVSGNNTDPNLPHAKGYDATRGYDNVTGLGIPLGIKFAAALCGRGS